MHQKNILLIAHLSPPIHGQAIMSAQLAASMKSWPELRFHFINACYATERSHLGGFSFRKLFRWLGFLWQTIFLCVRHRIDAIIITHSFFRGPFLKDSAFLWLGRLLKKKIIVWVHMDPQRLNLAHAPAWFTKYANQVLQLPDYWVACAPSLIALWPEQFDRSKMIALCNGIPDPHPAVKSSDGKELRVVFLSSMTEEKGWKELFAAAEILCAERIDLVFDFYGGPGAQETKEHLQSVFAHSAYPARIRWHGELWGDRKTEVLVQADLFCVPSWTEAFPLVVLEAMACGLPVIATRVGGIPDAIIHKENGWLFAARDSDALLETLRRALQDPDKLREIGARNRQRFLQNFSLAAFDQRWKEFLMAI